MKIKNYKGFTLIEMIVAVAIVAILTTTAIAALNPATQFKKANDARRKTDMSQIQKALELYYGDAVPEQYPANNGTYQIIKADGTALVWGSSWQPYINVVPKDPASPRKRYVYYRLDGQHYCIYASLDMIANSDKCINTSTPCNTNLCGVPGATCNFGVCSPNVSP